MFGRKIKSLESALDEAEFLNEQFERDLRIEKTKVRMLESAMLKYLNVKVTWDLGCPGCDDDIEIKFKKLEVDFSENILKWRKK